MTKQFKTALVILLIASAALFMGNYYFQKWVDFKMAKVSLGMAESQFPYREYTQAELNKMYPQIRYADVPTRTTPEQTYANFRQALKDNNLEMAIEQLSKESSKYEENKEKLQNAYEHGNFINSVSLYPEKIWRSNFGESIGSLCYNQEIGTEKIVGCTFFVKNFRGDWKMDSL
ncbi:MAG: hypothetical protein V1667_01385 [bacterium]